MHYERIHSIKVFVTVFAGNVPTWGKQRAHLGQASFPYWASIVPIFVSF